jgi:uncharacterized Zn finger protein
MAKCPKCGREVSFISEQTDTGTVYIVKCPECDTAISAILDVSGELSDIRNRLAEIERHVNPVLS